MKSHFPLVALLLFSGGVFLTSCTSETTQSNAISSDAHDHGDHDHDHDHAEEMESHDDHDHDEVSSSEVVWKELSALDELGHTLEALSLEARTNRVIEKKDELIEALRALSESNVPENATNKAQVQALQSDLASLIPLIESASGTISDREMEKYMISSVPLVESMMALSGVPHKHASDHTHTHADGTTHSDHD